MARQKDTCWRCGTDWASESAPRTTLQVIATGVPVIVAVASGFGIAATVAADQRAAAQARQDADRWIDEGGRFDSDAPGLAVAPAGGG